MRVIGAIMVVPTSFRTSLFVLNVVIILNDFYKQQAVMEPVVFETWHNLSFLEFKLEILIWCHGHTYVSQ